ncbi:hypothetical protein [Phytoactinopolyspora limicola]|uniref:hypothetical protein n=1 Tax=Phytoactinopolyspora limicola TaxID=2715536 RepID=UPI00140D3E7D|nr:hypothetical protein [Phytoactinopolyspora limicola]
MRGRLRLRGVVVAAAVLVAAGCGGDDEDPVEDFGATTGPETPTPETPTPTAEPTEPAEPTEAPTQSAEPTEVAEPDESGDGILSIDLACIEVDAVFTVRGPGLDPERTYWLAYETNPAPGQIEDVAPFDVDDDGVGEVAAVISEGAGAEFGRYGIQLFQEGRDEPLDTVEFELVESC